MVARVDLLETVIEAHGGLERWGQLHTVSARLVQGGALWALKGLHLLSLGRAYLRHHDRDRCALAAPGRRESSGSSWPPCGIGRPPRI